MKKQKSQTSALAALLLTVFIDLMGLGIVIPILAALFFLPSGPFFAQYPERTKNLPYGFLVAAYPLAQFVGAPILGDLSDKYGRKKLLLVSIGGTLVGYLITAAGIFSSNLALLFIGRLTDGLTGGNISVANSVVADLSTPGSKPRNFGLVGMAVGFGLIIGPLLGGKLSDPGLVDWFSFATPFLIAAALALVNMILIALKLPETLLKQGRAKLLFFWVLKTSPGLFGLDRCGRFS